MSSRNFLNMCKKVYARWTVKSYTHPESLRRREGRRKGYKKKDCEKELQRPRRAKIWTRLLQKREVTSHYTDKWRMNSELQVH